jgi:hypothetical protein
MDAIPFLKATPGAAVVVAPGAPPLVYPAPCVLFLGGGAGVLVCDSVTASVTL